ncbi:hypothetical protein [Aneurinibacillus terranovensis]|uniref:hypothetical protein n=1 Tax=Aneurinibacillus terranovensis TaxID=278991 RepID=UPI00041132E2
MPPSIRFFNLTRDLKELIHVSILLSEKKYSHLIRMSVVSLSEYRHKGISEKEGLNWSSIHQGEQKNFHGFCTCMQSHSIFFYDENEELFHTFSDEEIFFRRKQPVLIENEEKLGFLEIFSRKHRMLLSFLL